MSDNHIAWISKISSADSVLVGEKAANLGELFQANFPTPQGFSITTEGFSYILKENEIKDEIKSLLKKIDENDEISLKEKSKEIQQLILNCEIPAELKEEILESYDNLNTDLSDLKDYPGALAILKSAREPIFVSIRVSSTESVDKGRQAFTNIRGNREVLEKILECLASQFSSESIKGRRQHEREDFEEIGIIIQKMINSEKSGVVYSSLSNGNEIKIESIFGQGCSIPGKITPDTYDLNKDLELINEEISNKKLAVVRTAGGQTKFIELPEEKSASRVLKTYEIKQIAEIAKKIEEHYKAPQEIEFAIEDSNIYILQSKPLKEKSQITYSNNIQKIEKFAIELKSRIENQRDLEVAEKIGLKEIGLIKLEDIISKSGKHPLKYKENDNLLEYQEYLEKELDKITDDKNKSWIRLSEFKTSKHKNLLGSPEQEQNPLMGNFGIRFLLENPEILSSELSVIKNLKNKGKNIGIILPAVVSTDEIQKIWDTINSMEIEDLKVGISIDNPSSAILIKDFIDYGMRYFIIFFDELTNYTTISDPENYFTQELSRTKNPATLKLISRAIRECQNNSIKISFYSSNIEDEELLEFLIKKNIDSITINPILAEKINSSLKNIKEKSGIPNNQ